MKLLFSCTVGSRLYGINNEDSDWDYRGFGLPEPDELVGLKNWEQSVGKDEVKKEEGTIYSLGKFVRLCLKGNPTVLETNFVDSSFIRFKTQLGENITRFIRENFITKQVFLAYSAYFRAQLAKLQRPNREGKRQELIDKYGYDTKFASHAYRLGIQCQQAMNYGKISPTLNFLAKNFCIDIRSGVHSKELILDILNGLDKTMYRAYQTSTIPEKPDFNKINSWLTQIHLNYLKGHYENCI